MPSFRACYTFLSLITSTALLLTGCQSGVGNQTSQNTNSSELGLAEQVIRLNGLPLDAVMDNPQRIGSDTIVEFSAAVSTAHSDGLLLVANFSDVGPTIEETELHFFDRLDVHVNANERFIYQPGSTGTKLDQPGRKIIVIGLMINLERYISDVFDIMIQNQSAGTSNQTSVSHNGITWTFDGTYEVGTFIDGSPFVVGQPTVVSIDPPTQVVFGNWIRHPNNPQNTDHWENGSMLNIPSAMHSHGISDRMYWRYSPGFYDHNLNVAAQLPLQLSPGDTLISADSYDGLIDENNPHHSKSVDYYGYLTVLDATPPAESFRPPFIGLPNKQVEYTTANLRDVSTLPKLSLPPGSPSAASALGGLTAACYGDQVADWKKELTVHETCRVYGRDYATDIGNLAALLIADIPDTDKQLVANFVVQRGIDLYAIATNGGHFNLYNNGGHHHGRIVPILFAGYMLNHSGMLNLVASTNTANQYFGEDQFFYVDQNDINSGRYLPGDLGMAEWGIRHGTDPTKDNRSWGAIYRQCCTGNSLYAHTLTIMALGLEDKLRNESQLDYQSRYYQCQNQSGVTGTNLTTSQFQLAMWLQHAASFRAPWSGIICP